ncbi:MAG TPA: hypothetical protein VKB93_14305 [Thermoanaerobaculia bacterium]|nr:hypothetical protein [Thermoanaerobaculia bacterium]
MLAELVLTTRLLALVNGEQAVSVQTGPETESVAIVLDGKTVTRLRAPFRTTVNFGAELAPRELVSIAYDAQGNEIGRDTQIVNLARPPAEVEIVLDREESGQLRAKVRWQHIAAETPKKIALKLDGETIASTASVTLPAVEASAIHVLQAELEFAGGLTATKELAFGGQFSEEVPSELTGVLATKKGRCFRAGDRVLRAAAVEKPDALVLFVRASDAFAARRKLRIMSGGGPLRIASIYKSYALPDTQMRFIWPSARQVQLNESQSAVNLFHRSQVAKGSDGTLRMLTLYGPDAVSEQFADAVAVAGVQAIGGAKRRAVVLVLGEEKDESRRSPAEVRRYLERIGVPLLVWSLARITPEMENAWGEVTDISTADRLLHATEDLRKMLDDQRIAWLPLQPLQALRAKEVACSSN